MSGMIDHEARSLASEAKLKIEAHEDRCAERWAESRAAHTELKTAMVVSFRWMMGLLLLGMGSTIGMLVMMVADKHK